MTIREINLETLEVVDREPTAIDIETMTPSLDNIKISKIVELTNEYHKSVQSPVSYMGTQFQADSDSVNLITQAIVNYTSLGSVPSGFWWKDLNNNHVAMDLVQLQGLGAEIGNQCWIAFQNLDAKKSAVISSTTNEEAMSVSW